MLDHHYEVSVRWTGNRGTGTSSYRDYDRDHVISAAGKPDIVGTADPAFRGDRARWNPEELLVAALIAVPHDELPVRRDLQGFTVVDTRTGRRRTSSTPGPLRDGSPARCSARSSRSSRPIVSRPPRPPTPRRTACASSPPRSPSRWSTRPRSASQQPDRPHPRAGIPLPNPAPGAEERAQTVRGRPPVPDAAAEHHHRHEGPP